MARILHPDGSVCPEPEAVCMVRLQESAALWSEDERRLIITLRTLLGAFDATVEAGREGVSPSQGIVHREAAREFLKELDPANLVRE